VVLAGTVRAAGLAGLYSGQLAQFPRKLGNTFPLLHLAVMRGGTVDRLEAVNCGQNWQFRPRPHSLRHQERRSG